ncbi:NAD(P)H-binding protein [Spirosoma agri]|uniref:NAD(P)H-binding protein n=1 Tax=Spirosoma agri TaxID=1987381 RepID=A0A6M0IK53_9BACT|nr:NAD(P)H-binding protein [Spirosoma agri]NEU68669.1 NAD(P)H-binding protein [Spirosoma agri]
MSQEIVSIIGCGWIGLPLAEQLLSAGYVVKGSTTTAEKVTLLRQKKIDVHQLLLNPEPIGDLAALLEADTLVIDIPPKAAKTGDDFHPLQIQHIIDAVQQSTVQHVIYVSSTSVYPDLNRVVVEDDITIPEQSPSPGLVMAERLVQTLEPERSVTILRCGGLLGYDRNPGKYVAGKTVDTGSVPVNYLHPDDAVGILTVLVQQKPAGVYNAAAPLHPTREAIYRKSCSEFGYALPTFVEPPKPVPYKVISPAKLLEAIAYTFHYPDPLQFLYGDRD